MVDGSTTDAIVQGVVLETVLRTKFGTLLLTSDDCPFEECLHAHLLDDLGRVRERVTLGCPYEAGDFRDLERLDASTFTFRFFDDEERWTLAAHAPRWALHVAPCTLAQFYGPVRRPLRALISRSSLTLRPWRPV